MNIIYLKIPFDDFKMKLDTKIAQAKDLYNSQINSEEDLEIFKQNKTEWVNESLEILNNSFSEANNEYSLGFRNAHSNTYNIHGVQKNLSLLTNKEKGTLIRKQKTLLDTIRIIEVSDAIIKRETTDLNARAAYSVEDKLNLLLDKLYLLYDDGYYPIKDILWGNGIVLKRSNDDQELLIILENNGYVEQFNGIGKVHARLTANGAMYVEEKRKIYKENYDDINKSQEELNKRVDEIIEQLTKLGYGQQVIFDEIEELKDLYSKVSKKNWGQIVKGKVVDLALAKLVEKDTLDLIYHGLTNHHMRLP